MKQAAAALKQNPASVEFSFAVPADGSAQHCAACDQFVPREAFEASQLEGGPGKQRCVPCG